MIDKKDMDIKFNGKEYIEYLKYKDSKKIKLKESTKWFLLSGLALILLVGCVITIIQPEPEPVVYTWKGIGMFLAVCAGIGWIFHGTGFILIRR